MVTDITFADITNATTLEDGTGYFDKLMKVVTLHVESQYNAGKITGEGYASVYLGSIQSVLQQAQQFVLAEKLQEAQIDGAIQDNLIKAQQVLITMKELELKTKALELESYRLLNIIPAELAQLQKQTDIAERGMVEQELTGSKQRDAIDKDIAIKGYENTVLQVDSHNTNLKQLEILTQQKLTEVENTILLREKTESEAMQNMLDGVIASQINKLKEDIDIAKAQVEIAKSNSALEKAKAIAAIDKEYGYNYTLDVDGNIIVGDDAGNGKLDAEVQLLNGQVVKIRDDSHNQEWLRNLQATKLQIDAEVSLYASKRLDTVPSIINGDESATASYATLVAAIPNI
jgi:hypothetical protein